MNAEERELLRQEIDRRRREQTDNLTDHQRHIKQVDEIVRLFHSGATPEQISESTGRLVRRVRQTLRRKHLIPPAGDTCKIWADGVGHHRLSVPAKIWRQLPSDACFTCEMTDDGILYRPVSENVYAAGT
jgi:hypothetical protein